MAICFLETAALAQTRPPTDEEIAEAHKECEARVTNALLQRLCKQQVTLKALELRARAERGSNEALARQVEEMRRQLAETQAELRRLSERPPSADRPGVTPGEPRTEPPAGDSRDWVEKRAGDLRADRRPVPPVQPKPAQPPAQGMAPQPVTQPAPAVVQAPSAPPPARPVPSPLPTQPRPILPPMPAGVIPIVEPVPYQHTGFTWDVSGIPSLGVQHLASAMKHWLPGSYDIRVVFRKNGRLIPIQHNGETFNEFYADLNRDGRPDRQPYQGVDPFAIDEVFIAYVKPTDQVEMILLIPSGNLITIPGLSQQTLWKMESRIKLWRPPRLGRWLTSGYTGTEL